ncbi:LpxL/LpxP family Kdo(2)-lipid IV(A) lauroyl/palmitoleoyl acyltransferase [Vibrio owensii]|uniref:LpxL/LpxP family Kdo(2)-lipid IV(A) lauroyl/palmitoleoyl acyltransferase n=1 Tax=Vibrio owensii TaxID=696485 RepID=UPI0018F254E2|nr:LpxL/LpxP family Kdo(2)-lipid IV(A) lauroyl/palmitoleoyl acyltransferase [Vibrio owensii]
MEHRNTKKYPEPKFCWSFLHPRYFLTWALIFTFAFMSLLPLRVQRLFGPFIARTVFLFFPNRAEIIRENIDLCFPKAARYSRKWLVKKNIDNTGLALFETANAWFWPDWRVKQHVTIEGLEGLLDLELRGRGVVLLATHSLNLEFAARAFGIFAPSSGVYRPNTNSVIDWVQYLGRSRSNRTLVHRKDVPAMLSTLRSGGRLWYAPDHDYGPRRSVFAPFFAVDKAATTTGTSILMGLENSVLVPFTIKRIGNNYRIKVGKAVDGYPKDDLLEAARFTNREIEKIISHAPEEYMWLHRRFKTRPEFESPLYKI